MAILNMISRDVLETESLSSLRPQAFDQVSYHLQGRLEPGIRLLQILNNRQEQERIVLPKSKHTAEIPASLLGRHCFINYSSAARLEATCITGGSPSQSIVASARLVGGVGSIRTCSPGT